MPQRSRSTSLRGRPQEDQWQQDEARDLEQPEQESAADDAHGQEREQPAPGEAADLLVELHARHRLLDRGALESLDLRQRRHHARHVLNGAEGRGVAARHHQGGDDRGAAQTGREDRRQRRSLERAGATCLEPARRLRQERTDDDQRDRRDDPRHQRVAPRLVPALHLRKRVGVGRDEGVRSGHHQPADRPEGLGVADHRLAALGIGEELGEPRHRRHELDAHADEGGDAEEEQPLDRGRPCRRRTPRRRRAGCSR